MHKHWECRLHFRSTTEREICTNIANVDSILGLPLTGFRFRPLKRGGINTPVLYSLLMNHDPTFQSSLTRAHLLPRQSHGDQPARAKSKCPKNNYHVQSIMSQVKSALIIATPCLCFLPCPRWGILCPFQWSGRQATVIWNQTTTELRFQSDLLDRINVRKTFLRRYVKDASYWIFVLYSV